jgi:hypothetical protein
MRKKRQIKVSFCALILLVSLLRISGVTEYGIRIVQITM